MHTWHCHTSIVIRDLMLYDNINTATGDVQYSILKEIQELIESLMVAYCIILLKKFLKSNPCKENIGDIDK